MEENQKAGDTEGQSSSAVQGSTKRDEDVIMEDEDSEVIEEAESDEFEVDVLNENTFMFTFTELIKRLHCNICPPGENPTKMPEWMLSLNQAFTKYENNNNYKAQMYIAKLITNYPEAFEKYATDWILPLLKFVVKGNQFGEYINYLVQDICIILIIWGRTTTLPQAESSSSKRILYNFLNYLMEHAYHDNHAVLRSNIQIIKGIYENWGKLCAVPTVS